MDWVNCDAGTVGVPQTGGAAAQAGAGSAGAPPTLATTTSVGHWTLILWSLQC